MQVESDSNFPDDAGLPGDPGAARVGAGDARTSAAEPSAARQGLDGLGSGLPSGLLADLRANLAADPRGDLRGDPRTDPREEARAEAFALPEHIYARVFRRMRPRTPVPRIEVEFRRWANANAQIRLEDGLLAVRMADTLEAAPADVQEALAEILLSKLFRRACPPAANDRYRRYLNRRDVRKDLDHKRQTRGRKLLEHPQGEHYNLEEMFDQLNFRYFFGLMARPALGWSRQASRTILGHYDPSHNTIVLSRILDRPGTPRLAVEYVLFHEMLHVRYPAEHHGVRRCVHTREFKEAEKQFESFREAKAALRRLS